MSDLEQRLARLCDREEIREMLHIYSRHIDDWNTEGLRECFTDDVVAVYNYNDISGIDALVGYFRDYRFAGAVQVRKLLHTSHFIGNMDIVVDGDTATSKTYLLALNIAQDSSLHTRCNYYTDQWVRTAAGWRIRHRHQITNWLARSDVEIDPDRKALESAAA